MCIRDRVSDNRQVPVLYRLSMLRFQVRRFQTAHSSWRYFYLQKYAVWDRQFNGELDDIPDEYRITGSGEATERDKMCIRDRPMTRPKYVASCSGGKDSVATLLLAAQHNEPLDKAVFSEVKSEMEAGVVVLHRRQRTPEV